MKKIIDVYFRQKGHGKTCYELIQENKQLKKELKEAYQRINNAIEIINQRFNEYYYLSCGSVARVLSVLRGKTRN